MSFSYDTFLKPITASHSYIEILDTDLNVIYTIKPSSISSPMISNNLIKISLKSGKVITIDFSTTNESKDALLKLQSQIDEILNRN